ncbi:MAG: hypothetical protein VYC17_01080 [Nitrospinota bacterium]|nr:hypothetical protein [Nitrospinota bacterium]
MKLKSFSGFYRLSLILLVLVLTGCGGPETRPAEKLARQLQNKPQYTIILNDMKQKGNFFPSYYHQYRVDVGEDSKVYPFVEVSDSYYRKNLPYLGMVVVSKATDGKVTHTPFPNGYQYVGNPQYGQWRTNSSGGSFWEFYGKYMLISQVMNWAGHGLGRNHYNTYSTYRVNNRPYMGPNGEYGTNGTITKKQKPNFYKRRQMRKARSTSRFQDRVNRRVGRSKNTFRSRGFGFGK